MSYNTSQHWVRFYKKYKTRDPQGSDIPTVNGPFSDCHIRWYYLQCMLITSTNVCSGCSRLSQNFKFDSLQEWGLFWRLVTIVKTKSNVVEHTYGRNNFWEEFYSAANRWKAKGTCRHKHIRYTNNCIQVLDRFESKRIKAVWQELQRI